MIAPLHSVTMTSEAMPIGNGLTVIFTMKAGKLAVDWKPRMPVGRKGRKYLPAYRLARDEFLRRVAERTGQVVMVLDL